MSDEQKLHLIKKFEALHIIYMNSSYEEINGRSFEQYALDHWDSIDAEAFLESTM